MSNSSESKTVSAFVPNDLHAAILSAASSQGVKVSSFIRAALEDKVAALKDTVLKSAAAAAKQLLARAASLGVDTTGMDEYECEAYINSLWKAEFNAKPQLKALAASDARYEGLGKKVHDAIDAAADAARARFQQTREPA